MTTKLKTWVSQDTGAELAIRPVSSLMLLEVQRALPKPTPPLEKVQSADGSWREEPNYASAEYDEALLRWNDELKNRIQRFCVKRGVVLRLTDEQKQEVETLRAFMRAEFNQELDTNDAYVYVTGIACGGPGDLDSLIGMLVSRPSDPKSPNG